MIDQGDNWTWGCISLKNQQDDLTSTDKIKSDLEVCLMSRIKQRLLQVIEHTPEELLEQTLAFLEFLMTRIQPEVAADFDPDNDSNEQILIDLKASLHAAQSGKTFPVSELWDGIDV
jgi:hypothetical protein